MKTLKKASLIFLLFFLYLYVIFIDCLPNSVSIFQGQEVKISTLWGIKLKKQNDLIQASSDFSSNTFTEAGNQEITVSLFDTINLKTIKINVMEETEVIPIGEVVGIKLYTSGILVVGTTNIEGEDGKKYKPYENSGIEEGDIITKINNILVNNTDELIEKINENQGNQIQVTYIKNEEEKTCGITPVKDKEGKYKLGIWVRDSSAGVGTVTFFSEKNKCFAGLGHAITDIDTGKIINTSSGEIDNAIITSIVKGEKQEPGKIQGSINQMSLIGSIYKNTPYGIYGIIKNKENINVDYSKKMKVASRQEIRQGEATILCGIDGETKEYKIEIQKIYLNNNYDNKSMLIKVTDEELIEKTGGIVQGMSGSPIIQNGKFIGAITHVFVNDPKIGYAVFGDIMINELNEINN